MIGNAQIAAAASVLGAERLSVHSRRPFVEKDGQAYVLQHVNGAWHKIRTNAPALLQYDEWKDIDRVVIEAAVLRMRAWGDLLAAGLTHNLGSIGMTVSLWDRVSDMTPANIDMSAATTGDKDTPAYSPQFVPVPVIHKEFQLELRRLTASRQFGESLDTTAAAIAGRKVGEAAEDMLLNGANIQVTDPLLGAGTIYGYTTFPDRNIVDMEATWDSLKGDLGENSHIIEDVMAMQTASRLARMYGPWVLYVPKNYEAKLDEDYRGPNSSDTRTVRQRILALSGIQDIRITDFLADDDVILVSMTRDVVDLAIAQGVNTVQWTLTGGMVEEYKVMQVGVPRMKSDYDGRCGITHLRPVS